MQELLTRVETEAIKVGLKVNGKKTELLEFNQLHTGELKSIANVMIKQVENFINLGGWLKSSEDDINIRTA